MANSEESECEATPVRHHVHNASNLHKEETGGVLQLCLPRAASVRERQKVWTIRYNTLCLES